MEVKLIVTVVVKIDRPIRARAWNKVQNPIQEENPVHEVVPQDLQLHQEIPTGNNVILLFISFSWIEIQNGKLSPCVGTKDWVCVWYFGATWPFEIWLLLLKICCCSSPQRKRCRTSPSRRHSSPSSNRSHSHHRYEGHSSSSSGSRRRRSPSPSSSSHRHHKRWNDLWE